MHSPQPSSTPRSRTGARTWLYHGAPSVVSRRIMAETRPCPRPAWPYHSAQVAVSQRSRARPCVPCRARSAARPCAPRRAVSQCPMAVSWAQCRAPTPCRGLASRPCCNTVACPAPFLVTIHLGVLQHENPVASPS